MLANNQPYPTAMKPFHLSKSLLLRSATLGLLACSAATLQAAEIYTCVDSNGRRITSDRPIPACLDREQQQLSGTGAVKRVVPPNPTPAETAAIEARKRQAEEERQRALAKAKALSALARRYPTPADHAAARAQAVAEVTTRLNDSKRRLTTLQNERARLEQELTNTQPNDTKAAQLRIQIQRRKLSEKELGSFVYQQQQEQAALNRRYDIEKQQLEPLWHTGKP